MSVPRIFVSSTYYDLKYVRSSLELFIRSLGYESILSEKGDIAYTPDSPLDESAYREVQNSDIYVLIIGGRYGTEASATRTTTPHTFYERYESITKLEYKAAVERDIPSYILIERNVYAEYQTYRKNRENTTISYAHVDSVNVFQFIEELSAQPQNNPYHQFDKYSDIEDWLRLQWAGLFRELLNRRSTQKQLTSLSVQVANLAEVNTTLRNYLETVLQNVSPDKAAGIIEAERERLDEHELINKLMENETILPITSLYQVPLADVRDALTSTNTLNEFLTMIIKNPHYYKKFGPDSQLIDWFLKFPDPRFGALADINAARSLLGLLPYPSLTVPQLKVLKRQLTKQAVSNAPVSAEGSG
jgi:hypothetical protein